MARPQLEFLERQLDRVQSFIPRIDVRITAYLAIISAQIALLFTNLTLQDIDQCFIMITLIGFLSTSAIALFNMYLCAHPTLRGNGSSLIFFAEINKLNQSDYVKKLNELSEEELRLDLIHQIHRNSQIVTLKYINLRRSGTCVLIGSVFWATILLLTSVHSYRVPAPVLYI